MVLGCLFQGTTRLCAEVDLRLNPGSQSVLVGDTLGIRLFAVSSSGLGEDVSAIQAIITWNSAHLRLVGLLDPCLDDPCPPNTYNWLDSVYPKDANGESLNADCSATEFCDPYTFVPFNDGNALYLGLAQFAPTTPAHASDDGLWVTTFLFQAIRAGSAEIELVADVGGLTQTRVVSSPNGIDITGALGPPIDVKVVCAPPVVEAVGSRYLEITPIPSQDSVILAVSGPSDDPDTACLSLYVQADGTLDVDPVMQTPAQWGTVYVTGSEIAPMTTYEVHQLCQVADDPNFVSDIVNVTTWRWGDVNNDGVVSFTDVTLVVGGSQGVFPDGVIPENLDVSPCIPDGVIDERDVEDVYQAFQNEPFPCPAPCYVAPGLADLVDFIACMRGPRVVAPEGCDAMDFEEDIDQDVDLADFAVYQGLFVEP